MLDAFTQLAPTVQAAIVTGVIGLPGVLTAFVLSNRRLTGRLSEQFAKQQNDALAARDTTIKSLNDNLVAMGIEIGKAVARAEALEKEANARDERERDMIARVAVLTADLQRYHSCGGGVPCPFRAPTPALVLPAGGTS